MSWRRSRPRQPPNPPDPVDGVSSVGNHGDGPKPPPLTPGRRASPSPPHSTFTSRAPVVVSLDLHSPRTSCTPRPTTLPAGCRSSSPPPTSGRADPLASHHGLPSPLLAPGFHSVSGTTASRGSEFFPPASSPSRTDQASSSVSTPVVVLPMSPPSLPHRSLTSMAPGTRVWRDSGKYGVVVLFFPNNRSSGVATAQLKFRIFCCFFRFRGSSVGELSPTGRAVSRSTACGSPAA